ncbi:MAG: family 10 glycosylhydrolase [Myxococcota bacterium]|jgi:uncharacterized lipoprotein YddW (UPF0748 family)|nr:family 10 glycosylhydrolase [Myxococcota bacterium]
MLSAIFAFAAGCGNPQPGPPGDALPPVSAPPPETVDSAAPVVGSAGTASLTDTGSGAYRGLWVLCEGSRRVLEAPERIDVLIEDAQALGTSDLFVQVYRGGRAWYRSSEADARPYETIVEEHGADPLASLIEKAHAAGLRVHAWVNVLSLSHNREAPLLSELGKPAVQVDRKGRSILDYPEGYDLPEPDRSWLRAGTPGIYLDPAAPGVADKLVATFEELVRNYPTLDGLHLDYIRHPGVLPFVPGSRFGVGLDYGYGEASRRRFQRQTGVPGPYANDEAPDPKRLRNTTRWDDWRRDKVTELVERIGTATAALQPELRLSAAVIAYVDRAYLSLAQDWRRWIDDSLIDFAVPMIYTKDDRLFGYQIDALGHDARAERIWAGVGVWLFDGRPERAARQVELAQRAKLAGDVLFSYDAIYASRKAAEGTGGEQARAAPNLFTALAPLPASEPTTAPAAAASSP